MHQNCIPFYGCINIPLCGYFLRACFVYQLISWWAPGLFPPLAIVDTIATFPCKCPLSPCFQFFGDMPRSGLAGVTLCRSSCSTEVFSTSAAKGFSCKNLNYLKNNDKIILWKQLWGNCVRIWKHNPEKPCPFQHPENSLLTQLGSPVAAILIHPEYPESYLFCFQQGENHLIHP